MRVGKSFAFVSPAVSDIFFPFIHTTLPTKRLQRERKKRGGGVIILHECYSR